MIELTTDELKQRFDGKIFKQISETADELGLECYVVGGYVRDIFLERPSKDIISNFVPTTTTSLLHHNIF